MKLSPTFNINIFDLCGSVSLLTSQVGIPLLSRNQFPIRTKVPHEEGKEVEVLDMAESLAFLKAAEYDSPESTPA